MHSETKQKNPTLRDATIFKYHAVDGLTIKETADKINMNPSTVVRTKRKEAYWKLAAGQLELQEYPVSEYIKNLIDKTEAKKSKNYQGELVKEDDNNVQMKALIEIGAIYGVHAPEEKHVSFSAEASDGEFADELRDAVQRHCVDVGPRQRSGGQDDIKKVEGTVL